MGFIIHYHVLPNFQSSFFRQLHTTAFRESLISYITLNIKHVSHLRSSSCRCLSKTTNKYEASETTSGVWLDSLQCMLHIFCLCQVIAGCYEVILHSRWCDSDVDADRVARQSTLSLKYSSGTDTSKHQFNKVRLKLKKQKT